MILSVIIQAGGESRRMGRNKALLPFRGVPLIQCVRDRLAGLGDEMIVCANQPERFAFLGLPCHQDPIPDRGVLGGLFTAMTVARGDLVAVAACDMPFVSPAIFRLACERMEGADAVVPRSRSGLEPMHAVYRRDACLPAVRAALEAGKRRADSWFCDIRVRLMEPPDYASVDPTGLAFTNVNTPGDLERALKGLGPTA